MAWNPFGGMQDIFQQNRAGYGVPDNAPTSSSPWGQNPWAPYQATRGTMGALPGTPPTMYAGSDPGMFQNLLSLLARGGVNAARGIAGSGAPGAVGRGMSLMGSAADRYPRGKMGLAGDATAGATINSLVGNPLGNIAGNVMGGIGQGIGGAASGLGSAVAQTPPGQAINAARAMAAPPPAQAQTQTNAPGVGAPPASGATQQGINRADLLNPEEGIMRALRDLGINPGSARGDPRIQYLTENADKLMAPIWEQIAKDPSQFTNMQALITAQVQRAINGQGAYYQGNEGEQAFNRISDVVRGYNGPEGAAAGTSGGLNFLKEKLTDNKFAPSLYETMAYGSAGPGMRQAAGRNLAFGLSDLQDWMENRGGGASNAPGSYLSLLDLLGRRGVGARY